MEFYIARLPIFNRRKEIYGYKLLLCKSLREHFYALYSEPDDAEKLYRQLCFAGFEGASANPAAVIEFSNEMLESLVPLLPRENVVVEYLCGEEAELKDLSRIKLQGYGVSCDATIQLVPGILGTADIVSMDFSALSFDSQYQRIKGNRGKARFLAYNVDTRDDFEKACEAGYDYFQGLFYQQHSENNKAPIKAFNSSILRVISELNQKEPSFKEISNIIEHDVNLSYRLLRLVNSAYIAPKVQVKTISQALTILGLNTLSQFMSTMMIREIHHSGNAELLRCSLIRGKFMEYLAAQRRIPRKGSEAFFAGIFSLIDVILGKQMEEVLGELPLTDKVKDALLGKSNQLKALLDLVKAYEAAEWDYLEREYRLDLAEQDKLVTYYLSALEWAESLD